MTEAPGVNAAEVTRPYTGTGVLDDNCEQTVIMGVGVEEGFLSTRPTTGRFISGCEDFFSGHTTCPTCDGTGKVSKDRGHELVALIPVSDKRLHPRHTKLYVSISIIFCIIVAGVLLFFLFPRSINIHSSQPTLIPLVASYSENHTAMHMTVVNMYNITNENFYQVDLTSVEANMLLNQRILATKINSSSVTISMRSAKLYYITLNATFDSELDYIIQYCWYYPSGSFLVQFQAMATFSYFEKLEQMTINTYQYVHCPKHQ